MELRFRQHGQKAVAEMRVPQKQPIRARIPDLEDPIWIPMIEEHNRREREKRRPPKDDRPQLPLYIDDEPPPNWRPDERKPPTEERGVIIIQM
ncbi:Uncharacterised protein [Candidatus Bilamarchaeum dharawalense]|uniref:Uncharacterized protein n=1 Tax=Candidatus Bilamarchaeum dharawalense TaxID=2885759 RepID=A0A5E4LU10_9ARCH|nr:Uncharacterised protein [Candidatus Bilamarchaeum dharawalense]